MRTALWILLVTVSYAVGCKEKRVVCYLESLTLNGTGNENFKPEYIDTKLCTHVIYVAARLTPGGGIIAQHPDIDLPGDGGKDGYNLTNQLRKRNPSLKTMIKLTHHNSYNDIGMYSEMVANPNVRQAFVSNAINFVKKYDFNGFDFDWDFYRLSEDPAKHQNFALLLKELRDAFDKEQLLLSTQVFGHVKDLPSYDMVNLVKYPHFINLLAGYHYYSMEGVTNNNAPLYSGSWEHGRDLLLNVAASTNYWISQGAPAEKLNVGVPFFASTYTLADASNTGLGAPATENKFGALKYRDVCKRLLSQEWNIRFNEQQRISYAFKGTEWMTFETVESVREKAKFVNKLGVGGLMVWTIDKDDFRGECGTIYPLMTALNKELHKSCLLPEDTHCTCSKRCECSYERSRCANFEQPQFKCSYD